MRAPKIEYCDSLLITSIIHVSDPLVGVDFGVVYNAALLLRYTTIILYDRAVVHLLRLVLGQDILHLVLDEFGRDLSRRWRGDEGELEGRWREMAGVDSVMRSSMSPLIRMEAARLLLYYLLDSTTLLLFSTRIYSSTPLLESTGAVWRAWALDAGANAAERVEAWACAHLK